jgi:hypothetical protein
MLVCSVSQLRRRAAIAADVAESALALDSPGTGNVVFATLVDDPASVRESVDAFLGQIMVEAASAAATVSAGFAYAGAVAETVAASSTQDGAVALVSHTTFNPADLVNVTLSGGNLTATGTNQGGVRTINSISSGKYYWEYTLGTFTNGNSGVGLGRAGANLSNVGPSPFSAALMYNTGAIYIDNLATGSSLGSRSTGNVIGIAVDRTANLVWFRVAPSGNWNGSGTANPATGTGGLSISATNMLGALFGLVAPGASGNGATGNFGASSFTGSVPSGFTAGF